MPSLGPAAQTLPRPKVARVSDSRASGTNGHDRGGDVDEDAGTPQPAAPGRAAGPRQTWAGLPWPVRTAVTWSACLVVVIAALWLLGKVAVLLAPLAVALAGTLFLTALLDPVLL